MRGDLIRGTPWTLHCVCRKVLVDKLIIFSSAAKYPSQTMILYKDQRIFICDGFLHISEEEFGVLGKDEI